MVHGQTVLIPDRVEVMKVDNRYLIFDISSFDLLNAAGQLTQ